MKLGSRGIASVCSFYATKMMTTGEGGMAITGSSELALRLRDLKTVDNPHKIQSNGFNYKMTEFQAAMGILQLEKLDSFVSRRREIALRYEAAFEKLSGIKVPERNPDADSYYRFVIMLPDREKSELFCMETQRMGVACDQPIARPVYPLTDPDGTSLAESRYLYDRLVSIPIYPSLSDHQAIEVIDKCSTAWSRIL